MFSVVSVYLRRGSPHATHYADVFKFFTRGTTPPQALIRVQPSPPRPLQTCSLGDQYNQHYFPIITSWISDFLGFRILLGITDSGVDTVWRTPEGFVAPWANWNPGTNEPNGVTGDPEDIQDCVRRATSNGKWIDDHCTPAKQYTYYCEGAALLLSNWCPWRNVLHSVGLNLLTTGVQM